MRVWRIARDHQHALDGEEARLNGGRWNSEGVAVVYTSVTLSLAALELLVHLDPDEVDDLLAIAIDIPDDLACDRVQMPDLPQDWCDVPDHPACIEHGDSWASGARTAVLRVPSAVVPEEENVLINPAHADASRITVVQTRPFAFDPRLL